MILVWCAAVLAALLALQSWRWWAHTRDYWRCRGVPYLPPAPVIGSLTFFLSENIGDWLKRTAKQHSDRPYYGIWLFWRPTLVVTSAELVKNILVKDFNHFKNHYAAGGSSDPLSHNNLFFAKDPFWSNMRKRLTPFFSTAKLNGVSEIRLQRSKDIVRRLHQNVEAKKAEDLKELFTDFSTDVIVAAAFGLVENASLTRNSNVKSITSQFMKYSYVRGAAWTCIFLLPSAADLFRFKYHPQEATDFFRKVYNRVVEERGGHDHIVAEPRDILDGLLQIKREAKNNGEEMPEDHLLAQALILLQGGFETTAMAVSYTLMELAFHPEYQERLYNEIKTSKDKLGDADFDSETISKLIYLKSAVKESLRKYPAIGYLDREAFDDYQVDDKVSITKGTPVFINVLAMHYDPKYFEEPEMFKPERFFPENINNIKPYTYLPFGEGPRKCIAYRMGLLSVYFVLVYVLLEFEVRPRADCPRPDQLKLNPRTTLVVPDRPMLVDFLPRKR